MTEDRIQFLGNSDDTVTNTRITGFTLRISTEEVIKAFRKIEKHPAELTNSETKKLYEHLIVRKILRDCTSAADIPQEWNEPYTKKVIVPSAKTTGRFQ